MRAAFRSVAVPVLLTSLAWSQQSAGSKKPAEPPDPCDKASTQMEITNCGDEQARKAEARLTVFYLKVQKAIQAKMAEEHGSPLAGYRERALEKLKAAQLAWSHYRDAQCAAQEQQYEGGTIAPSVHAGCMQDLAERRMDDLQKTYAIYLQAK